MRRLALVPLLILAFVLSACATQDAGEDVTTQEETTLAVDETIPVDNIPDLGAAEPLTELDGWLQTDIDSLDDLRGKVVIVQFWTFGCHNCKATLPYLQEIYADHQGEEFEIVGVHSPEFDYEKDPDSILEAADRLGVTWPIALDTSKHNFFEWQGSPAYWPRTYVLDREGRIRYDHIGEGGYDDLAETVATLLG
ncbi:MAG: redoxin domain-containing protein [Acidimicrobiia bacterium]|nr:redoxin domain-containing protein [Acidimicrobiia bacterium]